MERTVRSETDIHISKDSSAIVATRLNDQITAGIRNIGILLSRSASGEFVTLSPEGEFSRILKEDVPALYQFATDTATHAVPSGVYEHDYTDGRTKTVNVSEGFRRGYTYTTEAAVRVNPDAGATVLYRAQEENTPDTYLLVRSTHDTKREGGIRRKTRDTVTPENIDVLYVQKGVAHYMNFDLIKIGKEVLEPRIKTVTPNFPTVLKSTNSPSRLLVARTNAGYTARADKVVNPHAAQH